MNDCQYEPDREFYIILKNAKGLTAIGDPSIARVTIIDDDEPGEFQFEEPRCVALSIVLSCPSFWYVNTLCVNQLY